MLIVYVGLIAFGLNEFRKTPLGFIPDQDGGYLITITQLPPAASLARTDAVNRRLVDLALHGSGRCPRRQPRRLFGRDARQRLQLGRRLRRAEAVRGARQRSEHVGEGHPGGPVSRSSRRCRRRSFSSSRRLPCAVSAAPAASA